LNTPGGFDGPARAMLERCVASGSLAVVWGHPHSLRSGNSQDERFLIPLLERIRDLQGNGRLKVCLPRELLAEEVNWNDACETAERKPRLTVAGDGPAVAQRRFFVPFEKVPRSMSAKKRGGTREGLHSTRLCVVSFKECWRDEAGNWLSSGGFPVQMAGIGSLFDEMTLLIVESQARGGGIRLPGHAVIVPLRPPTGVNARRKLSVLMHLPHYVSRIARHVSKADVIHVPLPGDIPFLGMLIALVLRKPLLVRYGGSWAPTRQTTLMNRVTRACMRKFAGGHNVMLATGEGVSPPAPGTDWIFATALSRVELDGILPALDRVLSNPPRLVYAGRLSAEKGVRYLVRAIALLKDEGFTPLPTVTLVGDGPERRMLETLAEELGCQDSIAFAGQLDRKELSEQLSRADLCVQPSLTEGFSKAWLDAMAHGLPVLASEVGAARAVIGSAGERGWLVPPGDLEALAAALRQVLTAPMDWSALRHNCRAYAEGRTLEAWVRQIGESCARRWNVSLVDGKLSWIVWRVKLLGFILKGTAASQVDLKSNALEKRLLFWSY
jgi:glycosyltransferase involved in cell wall biosynthesis